MPLAKRVLRYHELSNDALERAAKATTDEERFRLITMGLGWRSLATETEDTLKRLRGFNPR